MLILVLLQDKGPSDFQVEGEVPVGKELPRADILLLRRAQQAGLEHHAGLSKDAEVLRQLWKQIAMVAVVEFKSIVRPFARGDLGKRIGYTGLYYSMEAAKIQARENLLMVLM